MENWYTLLNLLKKLTNGDVSWYTLPNILVYFTQTPEDVELEYFIGSLGILY